jgi:hypothetical protein
MLNEWRKFLNEGPADRDFYNEIGTDMPSDEIGTDMSSLELDYEPLNRDHSEEVNEIETFLTTDLRCDVSSEEYASFISCLSRRENAETVEKLVEIVRDCVSGF